LESLAIATGNNAGVVFLLQFDYESVLR
jgi:hypothetical protein